MEHDSRSEAPEHADFYLRGREGSTIATYRFEQGVSESSALRVSSFELSSFESFAAAAAAARKGTSSTTLFTGSSRGSASCRVVGHLLREEDLGSPQLFQVSVTVVIKRI